ncbi:MAG: TIGR02266 family protein, partial [Myxococcales bacterium]
MVCISLGVCFCFLVASTDAGPCSRSGIPAPERSSMQETRKDPRAKVLTMMKVRYKSATVDEFIEHHSYDISRGGIFIKNPQPFPAGTLLKFEINIAEDKPVLQGVGRVVWKRDPSTASPERPAGMGVKFIKLDEASRQTIDKLIAARGGSDEGSAFDQEPHAPEVSAPPAAAAAGAFNRKATIVGLGAMVPPEVQAAQQAAIAAAGGDSTGGGFFPSTSGPADLPPPQERTVMRQAAELLQEALKDSMASEGEDIASNPLFTAASAEAKPVPPVEPKPEVTETRPEPSPAVGEVKTETKSEVVEAKPEARPEVVETKPE